jgi:hypothetical protein
MGNVGDTSFGAYASFGTIGQTILFGMDGGLFVAVSYDGDVFASR